MLYQLKKMFAGYIKVLGGPDVSRGPDVAQACFIVYAKEFIKDVYVLTKTGSI